MHAKPAFPAHIAISALPAAAASPAVATDNALSAAVSKALGGRPRKPHVVQTGRPEGTKATAKAASAADRFVRPVNVKTIAPRSGHR